MADILEVGGSNRTFPGGDLSNFTAHAFIFDDVACASMEGLVQSFKIENIDEQIEVCGLVGGRAKRRGATRNEIWQSTQILWWRGKPMDRHGQTFQDLLDRAFDALATNSDFLVALRATGDAMLVHSIGCSDPTKTVLTEHEFCDRLTTLRDRLCRD